MKTELRTWGYAAAVFAVAALLYAPTWYFDFTYLDDNQLIVQSEAFLTRPASLIDVFFRSYFGTPSSNYYRPIVSGSFVLNGLLGGIRPLGYHVTNGLLFATAAALVFAFLRAVSGALTPAILGALLFAVSPANTVAVAWIPGRNDLLLVCWSLLAALFLFSELRRPSGSGKVGHLTCLLLALLSKESAIGLPLVFLTLLWVRGELGVLKRKVWLPLGWLGCLVGYLLCRGWVLRPPSDFYRTQLSVVSERYWMPLAELGKLIVPVRLQVLAAPQDVLLWPGAIALGMLVVASIGLWRARLRRLVLAYVVLIMPLALAIPAAKTVVLENRLCLPMVGLALLASELLTQLACRGALVRRVTQGAFVCALMGLGCVSFGYSRSFRDRATFAAAAIAASPNSGIAAHLMSHRPPRMPFGGGPRMRSPRRD